MSTTLERSINFEMKVKTIKTLDADNAFSTSVGITSSKIIILCAIDKLSIDSYKLLVYNQYVFSFISYIYYLSRLLEQSTFLLYHNLSKKTSK